MCLKKEPRVNSNKNSVSETRFLLLSPLALADLKITQWNINTSKHEHG